MSMNPIHFQRGMPLPESLARFGRQAQCDAHLEQAPWPEGCHCPRCRHPEHPPLVRGRQRL